MVDNSSFIRELAVQASRPSQAKRASASQNASPKGHQFARVKDDSTKVGAERSRNAGVKYTHIKALRAGRR